MKRYLFSFITIFIPLFMLSQENTKLDVSFSYGLSYADFNNSQQEDIIDFSYPKIGSFMDLNLDFKLKNNRFIGIGFSKEQHSKSITEVDKFGNIILDNYRNTMQKNFYDLHLRKKFNNNTNLSIGVFYYEDYFNTFDIGVTDEGNLYYIINDEKQRADDLGLFIAYNYMYPVQEYLKIGVNGKLYYSLNGIETIALLPTINVSF